MTFQHNPDKTLRMNKAHILPNLSAAILLMFAFLPYAGSFHSTGANAVRLVFAALFLLAVCRTNRNMLIQMFVVLLLTGISNLFFYRQVWMHFTSFSNFMNRSLLCWLYALMGLYYSRYGSGQGKRNIERLLLLLLLFTSLTTILGSLKDPEAVRSTVAGGMEMADKKIAIAKKNIASWGIIYGMVFTLPAWIYRYVKTRKKIYLAVICFITAACMMSQITFAVLFTFAFLFFLVFRLKKKGRIIGLICAMCAALVPLWAYMDDLCLALSGFFDRMGIRILSMRFYQLYQTFSNGTLYGTGAARMELYKSSLKVFLENPLFGFDKAGPLGPERIGLHSQVFDRMGATGLLGTVWCVLPFLWMSKMVLSHTTNLEERYYTGLGIAVFMIFAMVNPTWNCPGAYFSVFCLPFILMGGEPGGGRKAYERSGGYNGCSDSL